MKLYKTFRKKNSLQDLDKFLSNLGKYQKLCATIHKKCNEFRKQDYLHWIKSGCDYMKSHNPKKAWKWIKTTAKIKQAPSVNDQPIKDKNGNLATTTEGQLKVWKNHYEKLLSDNIKSDSSSNKNLHSDLERSHNSPDKVHSNFDFPILEEWDINQDITVEEITNAILATPNYKASGPDGVPIEFYKALIPFDDENNNDNSSGMHCLQALFDRIFIGDFPNSWNEASIISIPKKGDLSNCDNYRGISLINNGIKLVSKIITTRISEYALRNNFIRPEQLVFETKKKVSVFLFPFGKYVVDVNLRVKKLTLLF